MNSNMVHQIFMEDEVGCPVSNLMMCMEKFLKRRRYRVCSNQLILKIPPLAGGGLGWHQGVVEGGASFGGWGSKRTLAVGVEAPASERRRSMHSRATQGRGGGNGLEPPSAGPEAERGGAREAARVVRANAFRAQI
jgi:hypothetical protein